MEIDKLREMIATIMVLPVECILPEMRLQTDLGMDSLAFYQMILGMEITFDITVEEDAILKDDTVSAVWKYIQMRRKEILER